MATLVLRLVKGTSLTNSEMDTNLTNLNNDIQTRLLSSSYTAADVLAKIKTVGGIGSGLDADLLNGLQPNSILPTVANKSSVVARDASGNVALNALITSNVVTPQIQLTSNAPIIYASETDQAVGFKNWTIVFDGALYQIQTRNDDNSYITSPFVLSRTGNATLSGNLQAVTVATSSEFQSTGANTYRCVTGGYGTFHRNDGSTMYFLQTALNDQYGSYNAYRPFAWNLSNGSVQIDATGQGATFGGDLVVFGSPNSVQAISIVNGGTSGANFKLAGNGTTTPNKYIRSVNGNLEFINSAYNAVIATLTDSGNFNITGVITQNGASISAFPSGTRMSFHQTSAPTGWTQDTNPAYNDALLRIVTSGGGGTGGGNGFGSWNTQTVVGYTALSIDQMPSHNHIGYQTAIVGGSQPGYTAGSNFANVQNGPTTYTGGGSAHTHGLTTNIKYTDFIIAVKN